MLTFATFHSDLSASTMECIRGHEKRTGFSSFQWPGAECRETLRALIRMMFESVERTHPGCRKVIITDEVTAFAPGHGVEVVRCEPCSPLPSLARSSAWVEFIRGAGRDSHIVLLDYDMLIKKSLEDVFDNVFDVGLTYRLYQPWPINAGIQFLHAARLERALVFYEKALEIFKKKFSDCFVWGGEQWAFRELVHADFSREDVFLHDEGGFQVLLLPCSDYNYTPEGLGDSHSAAFDAKKVLHFKGSGKQAMFEYWSQCFGSRASRETKGGSRR